MDVGAKPHVVGEIPAVVIGIVVEGDVVAIPPPIPAVAGIKGRDVEIISSEPEASGTTSGEMPDVSAAEPAVKAAMFPGMVHMEAGVFATVIVSHPFAVVVDVRVFGMAFMVAEGSMLIVLAMRRSVIRLRAMGGDVSATDIVVVPVTMVSVLGDGWQRKD